jgi:hypothetical protein
MLGTSNLIRLQELDKDEMVISPLAVWFEPNWGFLSTGGLTPTRRCEDKNIRLLCEAYCDRE